MKELVSKMGEKERPGGMVATVTTVCEEVNTNRSPITDNIDHSFSQRCMNENSHGPGPWARVMADKGVATKGRSDFSVLPLWSQAPTIHL